MAASLARREALAAAHRLHRMDWAFWAAASDAAAAVTAGARIGRHYDTLTGPLAAVMPPLAAWPGRARGAAGFTETRVRRPFQRGRLTVSVIRTVIAGPRRVPRRRTARPRP